MTLDGSADEMADAAFSPDGGEIRRRRGVEQRARALVRNDAAPCSRRSRATTSSSATSSGWDRSASISNDWSGTIKTWSRDGGAFRQSGKLTLNGQSLGIAIAPDGRTVAAGGADPDRRQRASSSSPLSASIRAGSDQPSPPLLSPSLRPGHPPPAFGHGLRRQGAGGRPGGVSGGGLGGGRVARARRSTTGNATPSRWSAIPLAMLNRHGLIAGATGTGKTKTLQLMAERLSAAGVPVFVADIKGDVAGLAAPGAARTAGRGAREGDRRRLAPGRLPDRAPEPERQAGRAAARDGVVVRAARARQGAGPQRHAGERAGAGVQVLRRPPAAAARLQGPARGAATTSTDAGAGAAARLRRHLEGNGGRAAARDGRSWSSRARARSSASRSWRSTT